MHRLRKNTKSKQPVAAPITQFVRKLENMSSFVRYYDFLSTQTKYGDYEGLRYHPGGLQLFLWGPRLLLGTTAAYGFLVWGVLRSHLEDPATDYACY